MAKPKSLTIELTATQRAKLRALTGEDHTEIVVERTMKPLPGKLAPARVRASLSLTKGKLAPARARTSLSLTKGKLAPARARVSLSLTKRRLALRRR